MKKSLIVLLMLTLIYGIPSFVVVMAQEATTTAKPNSYELFWPLSAGKVLGEPFYTLKSAKENFRGIFIFSDIKKAEYSITLSDKRLLEAEKLFLEKGDKDNGRKTLEASQKFRDGAIEKYKKVKAAGKNTIELHRILDSFLKRQKMLLTYMMSVISEDQKNYFKEVITKLNLSISSLQ